MEPHKTLEEEFGDWCGNPNTVACSSGSAALHLALEVLGLPRKSGVVVPEFTMISCARACTLARLRPVFVDCDDRLLIDASRIPDDREIAAIMPVHVYGRRCDMEAIVQYAKPRGLAIVEDLAEAHGVAPHPETDAACWSFYRNKIVAGEEGGMIAFRNPDHAEHARYLRSCGFTAAHDFSHHPYGMNYRMSSLHAAAILPSLVRVGGNLIRRRLIESWHDDLVPNEWRLPARDVCWVYDLRIPGMGWEMQDDLIRHLNGCGVAARHGFKPMSEQAEYARPHEHLRAYRLSREVVYLPVSPGDSRSTVRRRVQLLQERVGL